MKKWTIEDSRELYNINGWGTSYFGVNDRGDMYVTPCKDNVQIDLRDVMDELQLRDVTPPVLLRFPDILDNRIEKTSSCFKKAAEEYNYKGENFIVYPIKVNQMQPVVEEIISHGRKFNLGLECYHEIQNEKNNSTYGSSGIRNICIWKRTGNGRRKHGNSRYRRGNGGGWRGSFIRSGSRYI